MLEPLLEIGIRNPAGVHSPVSVGTSHFQPPPSSLPHTRPHYCLLTFLTFTHLCFKYFYWATTTLSVLIMKSALILASAGLAGLASAAFHTLKLQKIPLSKQLVSLSSSPIEFASKNSKFE